MITNERVRRPISDQELNRRWNAARKVLIDNDLDLIFLQGSNLHLGGYVRWFTDIPAEYNYNMTVLFPKDDEMTIIRSSASKVPAWALRGVKEIKYAPFCPSLNYTAESENALVVEYVRNRGAKRIGYCGKAFITTKLMLTLQAKLPGVEFVDVTNEIDWLKAMKSDEEMICMRDTARIHDAAWSALSAIAKPGMTEQQIRAQLVELLTNMGSEEQLMFIGTAPQNVACGMPTFQYQNRVVKEGDYGVLLIEVSGPGGYYCESSRNFSFGEPCEALAKAYQVCIDAQKLTADMLTPGRPALEIVRAYNEYVSGLGYCKEGRLYGHSQGYDLIERPAFMSEDPRGNETMTIEAGMCCSLHPYLTDDVQTTYINDNFYVTENGAERIHKFPQEMIIL